MHQNVQPFVCSPPPPPSPVVPTKTVLFKLHDVTRDFELVAALRCAAGAKMSNDEN